MAGAGGGGDALPNASYKLCRVLCERRNGWTMQSFCRSSFSAVCTQHWRNGYQTARCVSPVTEWVEKRMQETQCCVDATVRTRGKATVPEADNATRSFCLMRCDDSLDREREWSADEVYELCRQHM
mmetsp:Transcript_75955/g.176188  ORF Transcript_75955/g.176188 Transcript_75955/m.176188 type:complete len:126 (-) Transcript_75955:69-446(-)